MQKFLYRYGPIAAMLLLTIGPSYAQAIDIGAGTNTLIQAILQIIGGIAILACAITGVMAIINHNSVMPSMVGVLLGMGLVIGPYWYFQKMGGVGGAALIP